MTAEAKIPELSSTPTDVDDPTAAYKSLLRQVITNRPSGVRNRLAQALGKNKSFISQITNPAYDTPIPAAHLEVIFDICHFSADEQARFVVLYGRAHPRHGVRPAAENKTRARTFILPDTGDPALNREIDELVDGFLSNLTKILTRSTAASPLKRGESP